LLLPAGIYTITIHIGDILAVKSGEYIYGKGLRQPIKVEAPLKDIPSAIVDVLKKKSALMTYPGYEAKGKAQQIGYRLRIQYHDRS
jgi:hypothetical protein